MRTPIDVFLSVAAVGGRLTPTGDRLRVLLPVGCSPELADAIRQHKAGLLELMRLQFALIRSDALKTALFWVPDEETKAILVAAGGSPEAIYTVAELKTLTDRRITVGELQLLHGARKRFN